MHLLTLDGTAVLGTPTPTPPPPLLPRHSMDYALGSPRHGEAIHPGRAIDATVRYLNRRRVRAARRLVWVILFGEDRSYTIRFDGARWSRQRGAAPADVTVQTSPPEWVKFLSADPEGRRRWLRQQRAAGTRQRLDELMTSFGVLTTDVARTRTWKSASGHGQELRMRCFNPTC